jgi:hypothetical protein
LTGRSARGDRWMDTDGLHGTSNGPKATGVNVKATRSRSAGGDMAGGDQRTTARSRCAWPARPARHILVNPAREMPVRQRSDATGRITVASNKSLPQTAPARRSQRRARGRCKRVHCGRRAPSAAAHLRRAHPARPARRYYPGYSAVDDIHSAPRPAVRLLTGINQSQRPTTPE